MSKRRQVPTFNVPTGKATTSIDPEKAKSFLEANEPSTEASAKSSVSTSTMAGENTAERDQKNTRIVRKPRTTKLRRAEGGEPLRVYLPAELAEELRVRAARDRASLSHLIEAAVREYLNTF